MKTIQVNIKDSNYNINLGHGLIDKISDFIDTSKKTMLITEVGVPETYFKKITSQLKKASVVMLDTGEESKSIENFVRIHSILLKEGFNRYDRIIALGGGVIGDLAGFIASTYMRGISFINIPTTLLSQVDSSIGGKTAINFEGVKNIIGTFYQPDMVIIDIDTLDTLSDSDYSSGLVEAIKMAACFDKELFDLIENNNSRDIIDKIIEGSINIKKSVVERDEKEQGLRRVLNYGHSLGHGIELVSGIRHGYAVALGMLAVSSDEVKTRLLKIFNREGIPNFINIDEKKVLDAIKHDKKTKDGKINVITVDEIGKYKEVLYTPEELIERI